MFQIIRQECDSARKEREEDGFYVRDCWYCDETHSICTVNGTEYTEPGTVFVQSSCAPVFVAHNIAAVAEAVAQEMENARSSEGQTQAR